MQQPVGTVLADQCAAVQCVLPWRPRTVHIVVLMPIGEPLCFCGCSALLDLIHEHSET